MLKAMRIGAALVVGATASTVALSSGVMAQASPGGASAVASPSGQSVVVSGLNNPRHLRFGPDGKLYVAEAGTGGPVSPGPCGADPETQARSCVGATGSLARVDVVGRTKTEVLTGLPSVAVSDGTGASGPADVTFEADSFHVLVQDTNLRPDGTNVFGAPGRLLGHLVTAAAGSSSGTWAPGPDFGAYEARYNPDHGAGARPGNEIDSNPYAIAPYQGGYVVADAAGNDLLSVSPTGAISTLAVFPTHLESVPAGVAGPTAATLPAQSVPTSVVVGPDGALYVGELTGFPFKTNQSVVYRVVPGHQPTVYATGFTAISDLAFDHAGRLIVVEISQAHINGNAPGAVVRVEPNGLHSLLASHGLTFPTGIAVGPDGTIYVSDFGVLPGTGAGPTGSVVTVPADPPTSTGYRLAAADGGVFSFGTAQYLGSMAGRPLPGPIVGLSASGTGRGYWMAGSDGSVYPFGDAAPLGSMAGKRLAAPIVGLAATPDGGGYWLVGADGGTFAFGDAKYLGSPGPRRLNKPIVGIAASPDGGGYWLVASDGGIFTFGSANFWGSTGARRINQPIVGMAPTADGGGYWLAASDGGIFSFGDAVFLGSEAGTPLNQPIVGIAPTRSGTGYRVAASDGGIFTFGDGRFLGSTGGTRLTLPIVAASEG